MQEENPDPLAIKAFFATESKFLLGVAGVEQLPVNNFAEIAFAGRSNVGKSSLINALLGRRNLAYTSQSPGCTQQLNFYSLGEEAYLVDMPGYGFAKASKKEVKGWNRLIFDYLKGRVELRRVFLLLDSRRGVMDNDIKAMDVLDESAISYQVVMTKIDELHPNELQKIVDEVKKCIYKHPAALPELILTSSIKKQGLDDLRANVFSVLS